MIASTGNQGCYQGQEWMVQGAGRGDQKTKTGDEVVCVCGGGQKGITEGQRVGQGVAPGLYQS